MTNTLEMAEHYEYSVLTLNGITYVPHYGNLSVYVGPGYSLGGTAFSANYLKKKGAKESKKFLWHRGTFEVVPNVLN